MVIELSPAVYVALCGLVQDALEHPSDATHLLKRAAQELAAGIASDNISTVEQPEDGEDFSPAVAVG